MDIYFLSVHIGDELCSGLYLGITHSKDCPMSPSTPIAHTKSEALTRLLDSVPKGYCRYTCGSVKSAKVPALARKFHERFGIGDSAAQRSVRKKRGLASCLLIVYAQQDAEMAQWLMLATPGSGLESEVMREVTHRKPLQWLGYELVRYALKGQIRWTLRRSSQDMAAEYALLAELLAKHHMAAVGALLQRLANLPGFHGVREQVWRLFEQARARGYDAALPRLFYMQKGSHGGRLVL